MSKNIFKNVPEIVDDTQRAVLEVKAASDALAASKKTGEGFAKIRDLTNKLDDSKKILSSKQLEVNSLTKSDFIKSTDSPAVAVEKNTFLNNATDWMKNNPGYTILGVSAVGLAAYCFTTGSSLSDAASALAGSAGNAAGSAVGAAFSGIMSAVNSFISL
jgi:Ca2+/Na+ antiporter